MSVRDYLVAMKPRPRDLLASVGLLLVSAAIPPLAVVWLNQVASGLGEGAGGWSTVAACMAFPILYGVLGVTSLVRTRVTKRMAWEGAHEIRVRVHQALLRASPEADEQAIGERLTALTTDVDELQYGVSALVTGLRNPVTLVGLVATALWLSPPLAVGAMVAWPVLSRVSKWSGRLVRRASEQHLQARGDLSSLVADQLVAHEVIDAHGAWAEEERRFAESARADTAARLEVEVARVVPRAATDAAAALAAGALLGAAVFLVERGQLDGADLAALTLCLVLMQRPLAGLSEAWALYQRSLGALARLSSWTALPLPVVARGGVDLPTGPLAVQIEAVTAGWTRGPVLQRVNLAVNPGEWVAVMGPSGIGKSTLLAVIRGWLPPQGGEVRVGTVALDAIDPLALRRRVVLVPQRPSLLSRTVAENLRVASPQADEQALWAALDRAGCAFVHQWPKGLQTHLGQLARGLSGGERQRLCLARALLARPGLLLLDEALSQVDPLTREGILSRLVGGSRSCTVVMVCHDADTATWADRVLVLGTGGLGPIPEIAGPQFDSRGAMPRQT